MSRFGQTQYPPLPPGAPPPPGGTPPPPGGVPPGMPVDPLASLNAGRTAYQQLTAKHTILRTTVMTPHFPDEAGLENWYASNVASFQTLVQIALPLSVETISGMLDYLASVEPSRAWAPSEMVSLIEKLCLGQAISFPEIEVPARVIRFLSSVLRVLQTGPKEKLLQDTRDRAYTAQFAAMQTLIQAQAQLVVATANTAVSNFQTNVNVAQTNVTDAQAQVQAFRDQIADVNDELLDLRQATLSPSDLCNWLVANLPDSPASRGLSQAYSTLEYQISEGQSLIQPLLDQQNETIAASVPFQNGLQAAQSAYISARSPILAAQNNGANPTSDQLNAFQAASSQLTNAQNLMAPFTAQITAIQNQIQNTVTAHPDLFPAGTPLTDPSFIETMIETALTTLATSNPSDLMSVIQDAMAMQAKDTDSRIASLQSEQATLIQAKTTLFESYFQSQVEAKLAYYQTQITEAQAGFNGLSDELDALSLSVQSLQDALTANITRLGNLIGYWTNQQGLSAQVMSEPSFIQAALTMISNAAGKMDTVTMLDPDGKNPTQVPLWTDSEPSYQVAGEGLDLLQKMNDATANYEMKSPALIASLDSLNAWMLQTQAAYQIESDLMNSEAFMLTMVAQFAETPEGAILQSETDGIVAPLRALETQTATDQETMETLLNEIEKQALSNEGIQISDFSSLPYAKKQALWVGVCDHLQKNQPRYQELEGYIQAISARITSGTPEDGDGDNLVIAKVALMNLIGAQLIQRQLQQDSDFMTELQSDASGDTQAAANQSAS